MALTKRLIRAYVGIPCRPDPKSRESDTVRRERKPGRDQRGITAAEPDPDAKAGVEAAAATSDTGAGTAAAVERLFGEYHFPAGPRRILLAAATAFAERGFHATTTRGIAAQAGLSSAALYFYFRSKEEVLYQIATSASTSPSRLPPPRRTTPDHRLSA